MAEGGPFQVGDGNGPVEPGLDGADDAGMDQRTEVAVALHLRFVRIHAARNVDGEYQFQIDRPVGAGRRFSFQGDREKRRQCRGGGRASSHG